MAAAIVGEAPGDRPVVLLPAGLFDEDLRELLNSGGLKLVEVALLQLVRLARAAPSLTGM